MASGPDDADATAPDGGADGDAPRPNIVLVFTDDQGYGDLGCFGSPYIETPNVDRLAREGTRFIDCVAAPICTPSRAALMTGSYAARVGLAEGVLFPGDEEGLHPDEVTVADLLSDAGYATACIGKWHLGDREPFLPTDHGFDSYFGIPYSNDMGAAHSDGQYRDLPLMRGAETVEAAVDQETLTRRYTEEAVSFVEEHAGERPFFCYLAHTMPHVPLYASDPFDDVSTRGEYGDVIEEIDWGVGRVVEALEAAGVAEETLVVYTSDNGPWLEKAWAGGDAGPLSGGKFEVREGGHRVPAVARWPERVPAGETCHELLSTMDLLPTFARLAGVAPPDDRRIDGVDARSLLADPGSRTPREAFAYFDGRGDLGAVRNADGWKLHLDDGALYNLHEDVAEEHDVSGDHPDVVASLRERARDLEADLAANSRPVGRL